MTFLIKKMDSECPYCDDPGRSDLLPAVQMDVEKWGRYGAIMKNSLSGDDLTNGTGEPMREWSVKLVPMLIHPDKHPVSLRAGVWCKKDRSELIP